MAYNLGQNISGLFKVSAQFPFNTNGVEQNFYHEKKNLRVA